MDEEIEFERDAQIRLVDELVSIKKMKVELATREKEVVSSIIELARKVGRDVLPGSEKNCSVKEIEKIIYPEDKNELVGLIKTKGFYDELSSLNYPKVGSFIRNGKFDDEVMGLIKIEKDFRISLKKN